MSTSWKIWKNWKITKNLDWTEKSYKLTAIFFIRLIDFESFIRLDQTLTTDAVLRSYCRIRARYWQSVLHMYWHNMGIIILHQYWLISTVRLLHVAIG